MIKTQSILFLILFVLLHSFNVGAHSNLELADRSARDYLSSIGYKVTPAQITIDNDINFEAEYYADNSEIKIRSFNQETAFELFKVKRNLVHEYVHHYRYQINQNDPPWFREGLAHLIESHFVAWPVALNFYLNLKQRIVISDDEKDFRTKSESYYSALILFQYLYTHFGGQALIKKLMNSSMTGWPSIVAAIEELKREGLFYKKEFIVNPDNIMAHLAVAFALNKKGDYKYNIYHYDKPLDPVKPDQLIKFSQASEFLNQSDYVHQIIYSKNFIHGKENFNPKIIFAVTSLEKPQFSKVTELTNCLFYIYLL